MLDWIRGNWQIPIEILLIAAVIYAILRMLRGSRGAGILRGTFILFTLAFIGVSLLARYSQFYRITYLLDQFLTLFAFVLVIVFQPELRLGLIRIGQRPFLRRVLGRQSEMIGEVVDAVGRMSEERIGGLVAFEREIGLKAYAESGTRLDAEVTSGLLCTIFWPGSPLHDGAVIVSEHRVFAAGCLFPLSDKPGLSRTIGTRHRAGIGVTEESDAVSLMVSEETGRVSIAVGGQLTENVAIDRLGAVLTELLSSRTPSRR
jgi:diadenylate cyclase